MRDTADVLMLPLCTETGWMDAPLTQRCDRVHSSVYLSTRSTYRAFIETKNVIVLHFTYRAITRYINYRGRPMSFSIFMPIAANDAEVFFTV